MSRRSRSKKDRGLNDTERCWEIGVTVLSKLEALDEAGAERPQVQVYGDPGNEKIDGMSKTA
jgi:hypothetical protein